MGASGHSLLFAHDRPQLCTFVTVFGPLSNGNSRHKMTTIVGNHGQVWTSTLSPHLLSPHLDLSQTNSQGMLLLIIRSLKLPVRCPDACAKVLGFTLDDMSAPGWERLQARFISLPTHFPRSHLVLGNFFSLTRTREPPETEYHPGRNYDKIIPWHVFLL